MTNKLLILSGSDVRQCLAMPAAIDLMRSAFVQLSADTAIVPQRLGLEIADKDAGILLMPAYLPTDEALGFKVVSVFNQNANAGLPRIFAMVMALDAETGQPLALLDGEVITAIRTGAGSGLATQLLARENAQVAAVFGAGAQARTQLEAVCAVRQIKTAFVFSRNVDRQKAFVQELSAQLEIDIKPGTREDLESADVICTATSHDEPLFESVDLAAGVHVNAIGVYQPSKREVPGDFVARARIVVDQQEACLVEAGDIMIPLNDGLITEANIYAELGEIAAGKKPGRQSDEEWTFFKSVGNAVQDVVCLNHILDRARELGLGQEVEI